MTRRYLSKEGCSIMTKQVVETDMAPGAIGPYSQAVISNGLIFVSGQIALDPDSGEVVSASLGAQARRVLGNLKAIIEAAGSTMDKVLKTTVYMTDLSAFGDVNEIYGEYFSKPYPARATVEVSALPKGVLVEIDAIASL